ncbi:MAG TPA: anti-sigma factor [Chitinophagaceae bacterium]|nr:anti-sigma factor [Chitinophagaceae bacterium]
MNIKEYISSGIVESYVLGLASEEERSEFEQLCKQYPELIKARTEFEMELEGLAFKNAISPSEDLKSKVFNEINTQTKVISMSMDSLGRTNWWRYVAAACILLLAGSIYLNIILSNKNNKLKNDYNNTSAELAVMKKDIEKLRGNPDVKMASMKGTEISPQSFATVYWDTTTHDVYLMLNNLPKPASDKQYQLWALLDGQPIDIGLIDNKYFVEQDKLLVRAKNIQNAQAFAITLEKKGRADISKPGGPIYVVGNL